MALLFSILWLVAGVLLQVLLFNRLHVEGGIVLFYVYLLLKVPVEVARPVQILMGFLTGLTIDIFCNTPGMHALAATTTMWLREPILRSFVDTEDFKAGAPGLSALGLMVFLRYIAVLVVLHAVVLYLAEAFSLLHWPTLLLKISISILLTLRASLAVELARGR